MNSDFEVVDRKILKAWRTSYTPKKPCRYVFESLPGKFEDIKIGDKVVLEEVNE